MRTSRSSFPAAKGSKASPPTIREGDSGPLVRVAQTVLNNKGFNCGPVDARFGPKTKLAVIAFQRARRLSPDGVIGPNTWAALSRPNQPPTARDSTTGA